MTSKKEQNITTVSFPREILSGILSRLPAKCLGQCKCVCRSYRLVISDKKFVNLHLKRAILDPDHLRLLVVAPFFSLNFEAPDAFEDVEIDEDGNPIFLNNDDGLAELSIPPDQRPDFDPDMFGSVEFVGSCNGLICLCYTPNSFKVWNPTTKEYRDIPEPTTSFEFEDSNLIFLGFGYNPSGDHYNLVTCVYQSDSNTYVVEVLGLKVGSWTRIEHKLVDLSVNDYESKVRTYLNGALHWEVTRGVEPNKGKSFVFLNLEVEKYESGEILVPRVADKSIGFRKLGIIEGCLSIIYDEKPDVLGFWVMKEYGVQESWYKKAVLDMKISDFYYMDTAEPVCFTKNGEIIIDIDGERLVMYNIKETSSRHLKCGGGAPHFVYAPYVETLISPNNSYQ